jgi:hypothetical protein
MRTITLGELRDRCRQRANMVNSDFVTNDEFDAMIDSALAELMELITRCSPDFWESEETITCDGEEHSFSVATDHYKTLAVEDIDGEYDLKELQFKERHAPPDGAYGYRLINYSLRFYHADHDVPPAGKTFRHVYVPCPPKMTAGSITDDTTIDFIAGYEELVICMVAVEALRKEDPAQGGIRVLEARVAELRARVEANADDRSPPVYIADTRDDSY